MRIEIVETHRRADAVAALGRVFVRAARLCQRHPAFAEHDGVVRMTIASAEQCAPWGGVAALGFQAVAHRCEDDIDAFEVNERQEFYINIDACAEALFEHWATDGEEMRVHDLVSMTATVPHELLHVLDWVAASGGRTPLEVFDADGGETAIGDLQRDIVGDDAEAHERAIDERAIAIAGEAFSAEVPLWSGILTAALEHMAAHGPSLYSRLAEAGCEIDHHETDLYVRDTETAREIIAEYEAGGGISNRSSFTSRTDGKVWIELPFHHEPTWPSWHPQLAGAAAVSPKP